jgi:hypothetical protein
MKKDVEGLKNVSSDLGIDSIEQELKMTTEDLSAWTTPPTIASPPPPKISAQDSPDKASVPEDKVQE